MANKEMDVVMQNDFKKLCTDRLNPSSGQSKERERDPCTEN